MLITLTCTITRFEQYQHCSNPGELSQYVFKRLKEAGISAAWAYELRCPAGEFAVHYTQVVDTDCMDEEQASWIALRLLKGEL
jgi:hypothetical protein